MNCLVIEDNLANQEAIASYIKTYEGLTLVGMCKDTKTAAQIMEKESVDLLFLDVELQGNENGLAFYSALRKKPYTIIMTSHLKYTIESFLKHVDGFLYKPFSYKQFKNMVNHVFELERVTKIAENLKNFEEDTGNFIPIFNEVNEPKGKVLYTEITYIEQSGRDVVIYTKNKRNFIRRRVTLNEMDEQLPFALFQRINKQVIVNKMYASFIWDSVEVEGKLFRISTNYLSNKKK